MATEKKLNNGKTTPGIRSNGSARMRAETGGRIDLAGNLSSAAHDVALLAELQGRLLAIDAQEAQNKLRAPLLLTALGAVLTFCSLPMLLVAVAHRLMLAGWEPWAAFALVAVWSLLGGGAALWLGCRMLKESMLVFERSRAELARNIAWLKQILRQRCEVSERDADEPPRY